MHTTVKKFFFFKAEMQKRIKSSRKAIYNVTQYLFIYFK